MKTYHFWNFGTKFYGNHEEEIAKLHVEKKKLILIAIFSNHKGKFIFIQNEVNFNENQSTFDNPITN